MFSVGIMMFQLASLEQTKGFNFKTAECDSVQLMTEGIKRLKKRYAEHICEVIALMLIYEEEERPTFMELYKAVLTSAPKTPTESSVMKLNATAIASLASSKSNLLLRESRNKARSSAVTNLHSTSFINLLPKQATREELKLDPKDIILIHQSPQNILDSNSNYQLV